MKISALRKNARLRLAGILPPTIGSLVARRWPPPIDVDQFVLTTTAALKANPPPGFPEARREELAVWNPPAVHCSACGWRGTLVDCGRVHFPPDNIGWDCGGDGCRRRLVEGVDFTPNTGR